MSELKTRIASAARRILDDSGAEAISMRKIAQELGVSATAIYRHYRDKEELLDRITEQGFAVFARYLRTASQIGPPLRAVRAMSKGVLQFGLDHPELYDFLFLVPRANVRRFPHDFAAHRSVTFDLLLEKVTQGIEDGSFAADDPLEAALTIWAQVHGLISLYRAGRFGGDERRFRAIYGRSCERILNGICA